MGLAAFLAMVVGYGRVFLALGSVGLLVAVDRMVATGQAHFRFLAEFGWPTHFETSSTLAWFAVAALGTDALVQEVRDGRARRAPHNDEGLHGDGRHESPSAGKGKGAGRRRRRRGKHVRTV